jgi:hypothetical protein
MTDESDDDEFKLKELEKLEEQLKSRNKVINKLKDDVGLPQSAYSREEAEKGSKDLAELNGIWGFINDIGGRVKVMHKRFNEYHGYTISYMSVDDMKLIYQNRVAEETSDMIKTIPGKEAGMNLGLWWLNHYHRKTYDTVIFDPEQPIGDILLETKRNRDLFRYNLWEGLGVTPKKGNWRNIRRHIWKVLCNGDKVKFKYLMRWLAWAVQNPGKRAEVAIILKGKKGAGKGCIAQAFVRIFGKHGTTIASKNHLVGKHNDHLESCCFLFLDEAYHPGDKDGEGMFKSLVTEPSIAIEPKFLGLKTVANRLHIMMASNSDWIIAATEDERRFFINEVSNDYCKNGKYEKTKDKLRKTRQMHFEDVMGEINGEGLSAMLYDLLRLKLKDYHPRTSIPHTSEMQRQIELSMPRAKFAVKELLNEGIFPGSITDDKEYVVSYPALIEHFLKQDTKFSASKKAIANLCKDIGVELRKIKGQRMMVFPNLGVAKKRWDKDVMRTAWDDETEEWICNSHF